MPVQRFKASARTAKTFLATASSTGRSDTEICTPFLFILAATDPQTETGWDRSFATVGSDHGFGPINAALAGQGDVISSVGYLSAAIEQDFKPANAPKEVPARARPVPKPDPAADMRAAEQAERGWKFAIVRELVSARSPTQRDADKRLLMASIDGDLDREDFARFNWAPSLNADAFFAFLEELQPGCFE